MDRVDFIKNINYENYIEVEVTNNFDILMTLYDIVIGYTPLYISKKNNSTAMFEVYLRDNVLADNFINTLNCQSIYKYGNKYSINAMSYNNIVYLNLNRVVM